MLNLFCDFKKSQEKFPDKLNIMKKLLTAYCILFAVLLFLAACSTPKHGLYVKEGTLMKNNKPYRAIGANQFDLFYRTLKNNSDTSYRKGLKQLSEAGIPFVRFMCGGYWPSEYNLYFEDKKTYFKLLDDVVNAAEENNIGLIPSIFWYFPAAADISGEHMDQFGNPDSKTIDFIKKYTEEIVTRYKDSPAIWAWEVGNEHNLELIKPLPPVWTNLGTASFRTKRDDFLPEHMLTEFEEFAKTVRKHDKHRIIITGNAVPEPYSYNNSFEKKWEKDTPEEFVKVFLAHNPDIYDTLSIHIYPRENNKYPGGATNITGLVKIAQDTALKNKKPLFLGEFGARIQPDKNKERAEYSEFIEAIEKYQVPLSAFWNFDFPDQDKDWNITFENDRAYMIHDAAKANKRIKAKTCNPL